MKHLIGLFLFAAFCFFLNETKPEAISSNEQLVGAFAFFGLCFFILYYGLVLPKIEKKNKNKKGYDMLSGSGFGFLICIALVVSVLFPGKKK